MSVKIPLVFFLTLNSHLGCPFESRGVSLWSTIEGIKCEQNSLHRRSHLSETRYEPTRPAKVESTGAGTRWFLKRTGTHSRASSRSKLVTRSYPQSGGTRERRCESTLTKRLPKIQKEENSTYEGPIGKELSTLFR